jgi:heavy metal translocating P-type ATPase
MHPACDLCGLAAVQPLEQRSGADLHSFCCMGCMNVYTILRESGILQPGVDARDTGLFRESLRRGLISNGAPSPLAPSIPEGAETRETVYHVTGLWCASCAWLIEYAVSAEVMFASDLLRIRYCPQYLLPGRIAARVAALGYRVAEYDPHGGRDRAESRDLLLRTGVAAFLWLYVMTLSLVMYASYWEAISDSARRVVPLALLLLATPAVFYSAWPILRIAGRGALAGALRMEALVGLGILAAYAYSAAQAFTGGKHYYFDTACAIVTLVLAGKLAERGAKERTAGAIALLYRMMPRKARLVDQGRERFVAIDALLSGMEFLVKPGERIPADGVVVGGDSHVDESILSGESAPVPKAVGASVAAGSLNLAGALEVRATRVGEDSTLAQIVRSVESAMSTHSAVERIVDRVSRKFVPAVILLAALTFAGGTAFGLTPLTALMRAIAVLVIACPCALGIATPLAITAAVGAASRRGILVRHSRVLETFGKIDVVVLDKTGTVTEGDFGVLELVPAPAYALAGGAPSLAPLAAAAAIEAFSEHPIARAAVRYAEGQGIPVPKAREIAIHQGMGISGRVDGVRVTVGSRRMMAERGVNVDPEIAATASRWESRGATVAWIACDGVLAAAIALGDRIRPEAATLTRELRRRGIRTALISGDAERTTAWAAAEIGADEYRAGVLPEQKVAAIRSFQQKGARVAMAGDGINDAAALAVADLGIALGSGSDLAMQAAPVVLMGNSLGRVIEAFDISRSAFRVIRQNLFWAFFYNSLGIALAMTGVLSPILAAVAMVLSSMTVIGNSLRLNRSLLR